MDFGDPVVVYYCRTYEKAVSGDPHSQTLVYNRRRRKDRLPPRNSQNEARPHAAGMQSRFVALFAGLGVVAVTLAVVVVSHNG